MQPCDVDPPGCRSTMVRNPKEALMLQDFSMYSYIPAKDVSRARRFYEDKVGLKPKQEPRPVVKVMSWQPEATWPVAEAGS